jgi:hypothetical protein
MNRLNLRNATLQMILALLAGLGLGLVYSWFLSPVTYVDANPAILRADFKDQYRIVIAASYASTQDLARARARLNLLGETDPIAGLSAQAQRMLAAGEPFDRVRPLAQLATDMQQGFASAPFTSTPFPAFNTPEFETTPTFDQSDSSPVEEAATTTPLPTAAFEQTLLAPVIAETITPRPTFTPTPGPGAPFTLVGQETICDPALQPGLMQFMFIDSRRRQAAGSRSSSHGIGAKTVSLPDSSPSLGMDTLISSCRRIRSTISASSPVDHLFPTSRLPPALTQIIRIISADFC